MKPAQRATVCLIVLLLYSFPCQARFDISAGPLATFPIIIPTHGSISYLTHGDFLMSASLDYNPRNIQFFPSLRLTAGQSHLPVQMANDNYTDLVYNYYSIMVNAIYKRPSERYQWLFYSGLGLLALYEKYIPSFGSGISVISIDSTANTQHLFPAACIGMEYKGKAQRKRVYVSAGFSLQYAWLFNDRNKYYMLVPVSGKGIANVSTSGNLTGHLIQPTLYLALHFKPGKKTSSWYLDN